MSAEDRFHEAANDALEAISSHLKPGAKLALVIYTPGEPERDIVLKDNGLDVDEVVSTLRRRGGLSIVGDNAYKADLLDSAVGAMAFGYQDVSPPPEGHWAQRFWEIGRAEGELRSELRQALTQCRKELDACQRVIHYAGGFDPAYVNDAQAALKVADSALEKAPA